MDKYKDANGRINVNQYIEDKQDDVNVKFRHTYHLMPPVGWMNDPNGFCRYKGSYHMFYQYYPYDTLWGPMFWGHASSTDLICWENEPIALEPGESYDKHGIFSGTAIVVDDELRLYYTGYYDSNLEKKYDHNLLLREESLKDEEIGFHGVRQVQCLATSVDGRRFAKYENNPVVSSDMVMQNGRLEDFRDPKVWKHEDRYYMVCGSKTKEYRAQVLFYISDDGYTWEYLNNFSLGKEYGTVWECPDLFDLGGRQILIVSPQGKPVIENVMLDGDIYIKEKLENVYMTFALIGKFDYESGQFYLERVQDFDYGFDFYAPQSIEDEDGNRVLMAWMNMWIRDYVLHNSKINHGWNGSMTVPRKLELIDDRIYQYPIDALYKYRCCPVDDEIEGFEGDYSNPLLNGDKIDLEMSFDMSKSNHMSIDFFADKRRDGIEAGDFLRLSFDRVNGTVTLDRKHSTLINESRNKENDYIRRIHMDLSGTIKFRALLDVSSLEVFINDGEYAMTSLYYKEGTDSELYFSSDGFVKVESLRKWKISIEQ